MVYVRILKILGFEIKVQELSIAFSGLKTNVTDTIYFQVLLTSVSKCLRINV